MTGNSQANVDAEIDRLYQLPLDQFVESRDDLAARLRAGGDSGTAMRVHSLAKPSISAWAVNQLYWRARAEFDALMRAGQNLRAAQEATLAGREADVRRAGKERDAVLVAALDRTLELLRQAGHPATPATRLRVATDLDALAAYGGTAPGAAAGRLVDDLEAPGFEVFEGMRAGGKRRAPAGPADSKEPAPSERSESKGSPRKRAAAEVVSFEAIANARRAVAEAEHAMAEKRAAAHRAAAALDEARADVKAARADETRAKTAWEDARKRLEQIERRVPEHEKEVERAAHAAQEASEAVQRAQAELEKVKKRSSK